MSTLSSIKRLHDLISKELFYIDGSLDYDRITDALTALANAVHSYDGNANWVYIGECAYNLPDIITGAYWHYTEGHGGQWSKGYAALSALGSVYSPGLENTDPENDTYQALAVLAQ